MVWCGVVFERAAGCMGGCVGIRRFGLVMGSGVGEGLKTKTMNKKLWVFEVWIGVSMSGWIMVGEIGWWWL